MESAEARRETRKEEAVIAMAGIATARNKLPRRALWVPRFAGRGNPR